MSLNCDCTSARSCSSAFKRPGIAWDSAITAEASSPFDLSAPICLASAFRCACSPSVSVCTDLRRDSRLLNCSTGNATPRLAKRCTTASRSLRNKAGSSMIHLYRRGKGVNIVAARANYPRIAHRSIHATIDKAPTLRSQIRTNQSQGLRRAGFSSCLEVKIFHLLNGLSYQALANMPFCLQFLSPDHD